MAAGGIRHHKDLLQLKKLGIQQALIASALHNKKLTTQDIEQLHRPV
jgi:phosphoribosylformimino-5-aminoimidazole carboxamide ribotide isomerase